ncbi:MAG: hypothetical protein ACR2NY_00130 [Alphaproteobacteria bacterium]
MNKKLPKTLTPLLPPTPSSASLSNLNKNKKNTNKSNAHYQPSVFFRKPSGLIRYRHGGYNALFPLINTHTNYDIIINLASNMMENNPTIDNNTDDKTMGQIINFPKK